MQSNVLFPNINIEGVTLEKLFNALIQNMMDSVSNVDLIAVIDREGLPITTCIRSEENSETIGAVTASFDLFIERIKKEFKGEKFSNIMTLGDHKFYFSNAGENAILTIIGNLAVSDTVLKTYGDFGASKIAAIFQGQDVNVTIPKIVKVMSQLKEGRLPVGEFSSKIIICGDYSVGKTSLIRRFIDNRFLENYISTIGVDITRKTVTLSKDCSVNFILWDIGGQITQMAPYRKKFYTGANAAFIVFDKTRKESFVNIKVWLNDISKEVGARIPKIIVANKNDLTFDYQVTTAELAKLAEELGMEYIETSAKTGENVEDAFKYIAHRVIE
jgi:small GTP-binding protein